MNPLKETAFFVAEQQWKNTGGGWSTVFIPNEWKTVWPNYTDCVKILKFYFMLVHKHFIQLTFLIQSVKVIPGPATVDSLHHTYASCSRWSGVCIGQITLQLMVTCCWFDPRLSLYPRAGKTDITRMEITNKHTDTTWSSGIWRNIYVFASVKSNRVTSN